MYQYPKHISIDTYCGIKSCHHQIHLSMLLCNGMVRHAGPNVLGSRGHISVVADVIVQKRCMMESLPTGKRTSVVRGGHSWCCLSSAQEKEFDPKKNQSINRTRTSAADASATDLLRSSLRKEPSSLGNTNNLTILALTHFLKTSLDITRDAEIRRIVDIMTNTNSLYGTKKGRQPVNPYARYSITVDEVTVVTEYLSGFGFTKDEIRQLVIAFPQILCYSVEERIQDLLEYLVDSVGIPPENLRALVLQRPTVFGLQKKQLEQMLGFLQNNGSTQDDIVRLLQTTL